MKSSSAIYSPVLTLLDGDLEMVQQVLTSKTRYIPDHHSYMFSCILPWRDRKDMCHVDGTLEGVEDAALCWIRVILSSILLWTMSCSNLLAVSAALSAPSTRVAMS